MDATDTARLFWDYDPRNTYKHTHTQGINLNKADEYVKAYHWKAFEQKYFVRLLSKLYLPDIYRLDIPTTLKKPRDDKDSVEFYVITTINTEGTLSWDIWIMKRRGVLLLPPGRDALYTVG